VAAALLLCNSKGHRRRRLGENAWHTFPVVNSCLHCVVDPISAAAAAAAAAATAYCCLAYGANLECVSFAVRLPIVVF
jgi:hypothetical protein